MRLFDRIHRTGGAWLPWLMTLFAWAAHAQERPPLDVFFQNPAVSRAALSPDGRQVALNITPPNARTQLVVMDTEKLTAKVVAGFNDADIGRVDWVNNRRLVFSVLDRQAAQGDTYLMPGLFAVDADGSGFEVLASRNVDIILSSVRVSASERKALPGRTFFHSVPRARDSDDIFVTQPRFDHHWGYQDSLLLRLNTRTKVTTPVPAPGKVQDWVLDANGEPRAIVTREADRYTLSYNDPATKAWRSLAEFDAYGTEGIWPVAVVPDGTLYVTSRGNGDKHALYAYDQAVTRLSAQPLVSLADHDFTGELLLAPDKVLGASYTADARGQLWFEPAMKRLQDKLDALLPRTINLIDPGLRSEPSRVLVYSFSDTDPGTYQLYDTETGKLTLLGQRMRGVDARQMAPVKPVRYKARDGLDIPARLTLPRGGGKNLPMVVLVHGGPWVRGGSWAWESDAQFLASRGYAVLEPEYRGSYGFGSRHFMAGWKQWGLAMQNDLADGARWAIGQGIADARRICIAGASYGGYATLMGLVNDPDLYRCGINWVGVTDIDMMYTVSWSDFSDVHKRYGMPRLIGDRERDAAQLKATSPLQQAARITQPLLLAYGGADWRVPIVHGTRFRDAVQKTNPNVEWVDYPEEGHGWALVKNRIDFWSRVEKFLARNIGQP